MIEAQHINILTGKEKKRVQDIIEVKEQQLQQWAAENIKTVVNSHVLDCLP